MKNTNTFLDIEEIKQTLKSAHLKNAILIYDIGRCQTNLLK